MIEAIFLLTISILFTIWILTILVKWIVKRDADQVINQRFPFLVSADTLHRWLCDIITPQTTGRTEYTSLPLEMFDGDRTDAYKRLLERLAELKSDGRAGYWIKNRSVLIILHRRETS